MSYLRHHFSVSRGKGMIRLDFGAMVLLDLAREDDLELARTSI
jgi:hypothetical protein